MAETYGYDPAHDRTEGYRDWFPGEWRVVEGEELERMKSAHAGHRLYGEPT